VITLALSECEAESVIQELYRAIVLLDQTSKRSSDPAFKHVCVVQSNRLQDLADWVDSAVRGINQPVGPRR
jgi:hypothetical protein